MLTMSYNKHSAFGRSFNTRSPKKLVNEDCVQEKSRKISLPNENVSANTVLVKKDLAINSQVKKDF